MKFLFLNVFMVLVVPAFAEVNITPTETHGICLQRVYTKSELKAVPKQKFSELTIKVFQYTQNYDDGTSHVFDTSMVIGRSTKNKKLYGNTAWRFEEPINGDVNYQIECDGGSFSLKQRANERGEEWINFVVEKDHVFPLFQGVLQPDIEKMEVPGYTIRLDGNDDDNNTWRLEEVPLNRCDEKIAQIQDRNGGC